MDQSPVEEHCEAAQTECGCEETATGKRAELHLTDHAHLGRARLCCIVIFYSSNGRPETPQLPLPQIGQSISYERVAEPAPGPAQAAAAVAGIHILDYQAQSPDW